MPNIALLFVVRPRASSSVGAASPSVEENLADQASVNDGKATMQTENSRADRRCGNRSFERLLVVAEAGYLPRVCY